jgi:malate dehydrogenase (oxaloacetate-decarboxylating)(NADP+)
VVGEMPFHFLHESHPDLVIDGEVQADFALNPEMLKRNFLFLNWRKKKLTP